ncbi:hypothetical protein D3C77_325040 [compost metagenome]
MLLKYGFNPDRIKQSKFINQIQPRSIQQRSPNIKYADIEYGSRCLQHAILFREAYIIRIPDQPGDTKMLDHNPLWQPRGS